MVSDQCCGDYKRNYLAGMVLGDDTLVEGEGDVCFVLFSKENKC